MALSEYDQVLLEESKTNRKVESLVLLESVTNSRWFLRMSIIFFLNKIDVSQSKLAKKPMEKYFPEYTAVRQTGYQQDCQHILFFVTAQR